MQERTDPDEPDLTPDPDFYFLTKWYFSAGILRVAHDDCNVEGPFLVFTRHGNPGVMIGRKDWHESLDGARLRVHAQVQKRIEAAEEKLGQLQGLSPLEAEPLNYRDR